MVFWDSALAISRRTKSFVYNLLFASASFAMDVTQSNTGVLTTNPSITFALDNAYTSAGNLSFSDSITFSASLSQSALNEFLWNPESDPTTTWTGVTDPTTTWSSVSDPSTIWTKVDYPD